MNEQEEWVEYVVRQDGTRWWSVWMIALAGDGKTRTGSHYVSKHRSLAAADKAADDLRRRDQAHVSKRPA